MSLFVGNISKKLNRRTFQQAFKHFGNCRVDLRANNQQSDIQYAFVQFDSDRDAQNAKNQLHNSILAGLKLNIEWSKNSGRFGENRGKRGVERGGGRDGNGRDARGGGRDWNEGRGGGREKSWERRRRSNSRQGKKRDSPDYHQDLEAPPHCKRDIILLHRLTQKEIEREQERKGVKKGEGENGEGQGIVIGEEREEKKVQMEVEQ